MRHEKIKIKEENRVKKRQRLSQKRVCLSVFNDNDRMKIPNVRNGAVNDTVDLVHPGIRLSPTARRLQ
jgi:hypothetical protein